jgi:glycosyltransferase involved in cell wall biosynthesis
MLEEKPARLQPDIDSIVTVVVPTLNEEEGIARVIQELQSVGLRNILVIDGYSRDKTVEIAKKSGANKNCNRSGRNFVYSSHRR